MPPARSGVADYSAALLPELRKFGEVALAPETYDVGIYQLGNNGLHRDIYARALRTPGIAVLHDAVLQHFFLGGLSEADYVEEFVYNYGEWARAEARTLWQQRAASAQDARYFSRPMLRRIAETSRAVIVHNPAAAAMAREHAPGAVIREVPLFYIPGETARPERALQLRRGARYVFGVFGFLRESKRLLAILKTFARLRQVRGDVGLLIAGEFHSADLAKAVAPYLALEGIGRTGYMTRREFADAAAAVDCCINLRFPSAGETSAIAVQMMGLGKAVMLTEGAENGFLPDHAYLSVRKGAPEEAHLFELMAFLADFPEQGRAMGQRAREHIFRYHSLNVAAQNYWTTVCDRF